MQTATRLVLAAALAVAVVGCNKSDSGAAPGASSASPGASGASAAPSGGSFGPTSVTVDWTGKFIDSEGDKQVPVYKVTNHFGKDVYYMKVWYYFYDGSKKQIGREFFERYSLNLKPGESREMPLGTSRDKMAKGDIKAIQAVVVGSTYPDKGVWNGDVKTLAPEQRPQK
jgi:predicted component of type VI protein secretion system